MPQIEDLTAQKYATYLVTLTCRHARGDDLADIIQRLKKAWQLLTSGRKWKAFKEELEGIEYVRGFDVTHSDRNGWHPHLHILLSLKGKKTKKRAEWFMRRWAECLHAVGLESLPDAQNCVRAKSPAQATRYAVSPASIYEATAMAKKRARKTNSGLTAFEIMERACEDVKEGRKVSRYIALWREYVKATKGVRQVTTSRGLKLSDDSDFDLNAEDDGIQLVAEIGPQTLIILDRKRLTSRLLDICENGEDAFDRCADVRGFLDHFVGAGDWFICEVIPDQEPEPPEPPPPPAEPEKPKPQHRRYWMHKSDFIEEKIPV